MKSKSVFPSDKIPVSGGDVRTGNGGNQKDSGNLGFPENGAPPADSIGNRPGGLRLRSFWIRSDKVCGAFGYGRINFVFTIKTAWNRDTDSSWLQGMGDGFVFPMRKSFRVPECSANI